MSMCKKCGFREGETFTFYYGDKETWYEHEEGTSYHPIRIVEILANLKIKYLHMETQSEWICNACVTQERRSMFIKGLIGALIVLVYIIISTFILEMDRHTQLPYIIPYLILSIITLITGLIFLPLFVKSLRDSKKEMGENMAIKLNLKNLRAMKKSFLTEEKYKKWEKEFYPHREKPNDI